MINMQNDKKDLNAVLASLDPKLRDKIELPQQEKGTDIKPVEQAVPEIIPEPAEKTPGTKPDETIASLDPRLKSIINGEDSETPKDSLAEAQDKAAAILSFEGGSKEGLKHKNGAAYLALELLILEIIAFILFFATYSSEIFGGLGLVAMLMPAIVGILMRMFKDQLSLKEAVSKCKLHIGLSCFFLVCIMLSA